MMRKVTRRLRHPFTLLPLCLLFCACAVEKHIPDGQLFLKDVKVVSTDNKATKDYLLGDYVQQSPNSKWFGAKIPLKTYCLSSPKSNGWASRFLRKIGQRPEIYDSLKTEQTIDNMQRVLVNAGYMHPHIETKKSVKGKKLTLTYEITPNKRYSIRHLKRIVDDPHLEQLICGQDTAESLLRVGTPLDINQLNEERSRITAKLRNTGFYKFNKDYITFDIDTLRGNTDADVTMRLRLHMESSHAQPEPHPQFRIGHVTFNADTPADDARRDSLEHRGTTIYFGDKLHFRPNLLTSNTLLHAGELYNEDSQKRTYSNFTRLKAVAYSNIRLLQRPNTDTLDCNIIVSHARPHSLSLDIEGTNSAGDLGAAASTTIQHKNLFKGSETLTLKLRGAYESITGLDGYEGHSYTELGGEVSLGFPSFLLPFVKREFGTAHSATSEISLQYNRQDRPEFNRRVLTAAWRYKWKSRSQKTQHRFDLLEVNYIYMPWISQKFREQYLDSLGKQNAILRYNYENLLITKLGYSFTYNSLGTAVTTTYGKNAYVVKGNIETSGNALYGITSAVGGKRNSQGQRTFCGIAFAQYIKGDLDFAKSIRIDKNNSVALHAAIGIAYPYGNSNQLPFEKRYFAGGANSVRGWSVRALGPGAYKGADKQINFLNQSGDVKLDLNLEYRAFLFWKLNGALFVDAGNIWTIRKYDDQPEGEFRLGSFYRQIAMSYGIGLRMNLDFFILRFDAGMKAVNPAGDGRDRYPLVRPDFGRDFALHFAVGLPF